MDAAAGNSSCQSPPAPVAEERRKGIRGGIGSGASGAHGPRLALGSAQDLGFLSFMGQTIVNGLGLA
uniref:Uncharacterized protein n=1 Tax=Oryza sativa subsp. japonica TaxID=39947 RepID=Q69TA4_ORYSJ|nr:hypothetical protein [Oryza sativa Japonica Group]BAD33220.1 hypothetical protein [Oryza sativa Japonica Group]